MVTAAEVLASGALAPRKHVLAVEFPRYCKGVVTPGSVWSVAGATTVRTYEHNNFQITEDLLVATNAEFIRPSGELLARWIHKNIEGVGEVIARRLVRALPNIDAIVRDGNVEALVAISGVSCDRAQALIKNWPSESLYAVMEWLQGSGLPMALSDRLTRVYGDKTLETLKADPFLLLTFGVSLKKIKSLIRKLNIILEEDLLIAGVAEHVTSRHCLQTGSTVITEKQLETGAFSILKDSSANRAVEVALTKGVLIKVENGLQAIGAAVMERTVAKFLIRTAQRRPGAASLAAGWEVACDEEMISDALNKFEATLPFDMTCEQKAAVIGAVSAPVCAISGGAGTGKTTILLALLRIYDALASGLATFQVALSGRAAQRMAQSTGKPAVTIAKLLSDHLGEKKPDLPDHLLLVIDEASMVDLLTMYKLVGILPYATRIIFVGDTAQLPPVGGGLVFHAVTTSHFPTFHLSQVKRQGEDSLIHKFATLIRDGSFEPPTQLIDKILTENLDCCYSADCSLSKIQHIWQEANGEEKCIILTPIRKGNLGVDNINQHLQAVKGIERPLVRYMDGQQGWIPWVTRGGVNLLLGDQVMVTANDYELDVRNGDLGVISEIFNEPSESGHLGWITLGDFDVPISPELLQNLDLGYAITIHKSQGSQWPVCILLLPSYASHMLDQTLTYTAVTRASEQLVILGDINLINYAVKRGSLALARQTNLLPLLKP